MPCGMDEKSTKRTRVPWLSLWWEYPETFCSRVDNGQKAENFRGFFDRRASCLVVPKPFVKPDAAENIKV